MSLGDTYHETQRAISDVLDARDLARTGGGRFTDAEKWPAWGQLLLAVAIVVVTVVLAYAALDKRISLIEQKLDYVVQRVGQAPR